MEVAGGGGGKGALTPSLGTWTCSVACSRCTDNRGAMQHFAVVLDSSIPESVASERSRQGNRGSEMAAQMDGNATTL